MDVNPLHSLCFTVVPAPALWLLLSPLVTTSETRPLVKALSGLTGSEWKGAIKKKVSVGRIYKSLPLLHLRFFVSLLLTKTSQGMGGGVFCHCSVFNGAETERNRGRRAESKRQGQGRKRQRTYWHSVVAFFIRESKPCSSRPDAWLVCYQSLFY